MTKNKITFLLDLGDGERAYGQRAHDTKDALRQIPGRFFMAKVVGIQTQIDTSKLYKRRSELNQKE